MSFAAVARADEPPPLPPPTPMPAQTPPSEDVDPPPSEAPPKHHHHAKDKQARKAADEAEHGKLDVGGRVFLRSVNQSVNDAHWTSEMKVASARLRLRYEWKRLRAVVSFEAAGTPKLKDGYVALDLPSRFELVGGQFKVPLSPLENESQFSLPMIGRGLLSDVLDNSFHVTGRRPGAMLSWEGKNDLGRPGLQLAVFQEEDFSGKNATGATKDDGLALDAVGRATLGFKWGVSEAQLGVGGSYRLLAPAPLEAPERYWAGSFDASIDHTSAAGGVRAWVEAFVGENSIALDTTPATPTNPIFMAARGLAAWRVGGVEKGGWFFEPFAMGSLLDPNLDNAADGVWETAVGVGVGQWRRWKLQGQFEVWQKSSLTPPTLQAGGADLANHKAVLVQLAAGF
jgi:hypothetical protein